MLIANECLKLIFRWKTSIAFYLLPLLSRWFSQLRFGVHIPHHRLKRAGCREGIVFQIFGRYSLPKETKMDEIWAATTRIVSEKDCYTLCICCMFLPRMEIILRYHLTRGCLSLQNFFNISFTFMYFYGFVSPVSLDISVQPQNGLAFLSSGATSIVLDQILQFQHIQLVLQRWVALQSKVGR